MHSAPDLTGSSKDVSKAFRASCQTAMLERNTQGVREKFIVIEKEKEKDSSD